MYDQVVVISTNDCFYYIVFVSRYFLGLFVSNINEPHSSVISCVVLRSNKVSNLVLIAVFQPQFVIPVV